ncbi:MAG TPA: ABC transporter ATP-binding protein [Gemmatimonadaceae bacterium]|nr:ABC transporter ATP-binding protein [Gemmatimonadaceae bacterium]
MTSVASPGVTFEPGTTSGTAVSLRGLAKSFAKRRGWREIAKRPFNRERVPALRDVSCEIRPGEFFGLLGPNGAGKTTLFKMLATLVTPDEGTAIICGHDVRRDPDRVRRVLAPVIADERSLNWRLSARENMRLYAALNGLRGARATERVAELLGLVELTEAADRQVAGFSSGMKQRLLVARTLLANPQVLLLDEPTRSLDPLSARAFRRFLRQDVAIRHGCTVLLATHSADEAFDLCDRVGVLHKGRLIAVGATSELASTVAEERYSIWLQTDGRGAIAALEATRLVGRIDPPVDEPNGWVRVELEIPGGIDAAADVVAALTRANVRVARCERLALSLADLLERTLQRYAANADA